MSRVMALVPTYEHGDAAPEDVEPGSLLLDQAPTPSPEGVTWVSHVPPAKALLLIHGQ